MDYYIEHFEEVWNDCRFKILNLEIKDLTSILSSEKLKNTSQKTVLHVIHDWVIANKKDRLKHLPKLLKENLHFDRLTKHFVEENIFKNVIYMLLPCDFQTDLKNFLENVKFYELFCINKNDGYLEIYDHQHNNWHSSSLSLQLPVKQYTFELALLGSMLYAFGGWDYNNKASNQMWSRDLSDRSSQWTARADMKQSREWFSSVVLNDTIYILGGGDTNRHPLRSCERYCSHLNQWSTVADMNRVRVGASAAVINGCIYVAGGRYNARIIERTVEKYCPETDTWREVAPMTTKRYLFTLTPFAGRLWAIGGVGGDDRDALSSCESYDPVTDTWREEAPMKKEKWGHAAIEFNGELYVVSGKKIRKQVSIVEKYVLGNGWTEVGQLQNFIANSKLIIVPSVYASYFN